MLGTFDSRKDVQSGSTENSRNDQLNAAAAIKKKDVPDKRVCTSMQPVVDALVGVTACLNLTLPSRSPSYWATVVTLCKVKA